MLMLKCIFFLLHTDFWLKRMLKRSRHALRSGNKLNLVGSILFETFFHFLNCFLCVKKQTNFSKKKKNWTINKRGKKKNYQKILVIKLLDIKFFSSKRREFWFKMLKILYDLRPLFFQLYSKNFVNVESTFFLYIYI